MEFDVFILVLDLDSSFFRSYIAVSKLYFLENSAMLFIQGVHKVRVHFKKFITLFLFVIEIICKNV